MWRDEWGAVNKGIMKTAPTRPHFTRSRPSAHAASLSRSAKGRDAPRSFTPHGPEASLVALSWPAFLLSSRTGLARPPHLLHSLRSFRRVGGPAGGVMRRVTGLRSGGNRPEPAPAHSLLSWAGPYVTHVHYVHRSLRTERKWSEERTVGRMRARQRPTFGREFCPSFSPLRTSLTTVRPVRRPKGPT